MTKLDLQDKNAPRRGAALELWRLFKFALIGGLATLIHMSIAVSLTGFWDYSPYLANLIAFLIAFIASFLGHRYVTFAGMQSRFFASLKAFFLIAASGFLANNVVLAVLVQWQILNKIVALMVAALVIPVVTFVAARLWAFAERP